MNDRAVTLLENYDITILRTRKGRGMILCDTEQGTLCFQEYFGQKRRLEIMMELMKRAQSSGVPTQMLYATKEGELLIKDSDGISYILKSFPEGREMNILEEEEVKEAVRLLARLHNCMETVENTTVFPQISMVEEYQKRNREMIKVQRFLRKKGQKTDFERKLLGVSDAYLQKALEVSKAYEKFDREAESAKAFCHGDFQYHHLIYHGDTLTLLNFERIVQDRQIRDLYFFLRKILEKNNWDINMGLELLSEYGKERRMDTESITDLYYRFSYPEKFWKIMNFYMNSSKSFIPMKNDEKLTNLLLQENAKEAFLKELGI